MQFSFSKIRQLTDIANPDSLSNRLRSRRFVLFECLVSSLKRPIRILDIGGTNQFWKNSGWVDRSDIHIVTLNMQTEPKLFSNVEPIVGDATDLRQFPDTSFDVVFSNSVIEHLFTLENQERMAKEIRRVGKSYWVQTPNYWFPIEPHFHFPGWQWMPFNIRVSLIRRWKCGWLGPYSDLQEANQRVREVRLMTSQELRRAFPEGTLIPERFAGFIKSWVVVHGFPDSPKEI